MYPIAQTTERQSSQLLGLAEEVLRAHELSVIGSGPRRSTISSPDFDVVYLEIPVKASFREVGDMNFQLAALVAERLDETPEEVVVAFTAAEP